MQSLTDEIQRFREEVERFMAETGMTATMLGKKAMGDPTFVFDLRRGSMPGATTVDKVRAWMASQMVASP